MFTRLLEMVLFTLLALPLTAGAHPMGTLSTNRSALLQLSRQGTQLWYVVDFAEVPSVAETQRRADWGAGYAVRRMEALLPGLALSLDGVARPLQIRSCEASEGQGEGGLPVVLLRCSLSADPLLVGRVAFSDHNFSGSVGWRELAVLADDLPLHDVSPANAVLQLEVPAPFQSPLDQRDRDQLSLRVGSPRPASVASAPVGASQLPQHPAGHGLAAMIGADELTPRFVLFALLAAVVLGAAHALSPGHGKTVVAAYLVGARGTVRQALLLGLVVTITHVSSVLALGVITLWLSEYVVAAELYPWIGVLSGLGVVSVGAGLLRSRWRQLRAPPHGHGSDGHDHGPDGHDHGPGGHDHGPGGHHHGPGGHSHVHLDARGEPVSLWQLLVLGVTGGAVPCPSALVVLLSAIALHRLAFGLLLIVAFSVGLALVLMAIAVLVVKAGPLLDRLGGSARGAAWLPVASASVVMLLGVAIALQSAHEGGLLR